MNLKRIHTLFAAVAMAVTAMAQGTTDAAAGSTAAAADVTIAQSSYRPQTTWPYLFAEFQKAEIRNEVEEGDSTVYVAIQALYNIHLNKSQLQYVDASDKRVHLALIYPSQYIMLDGRKYVSRDGRMMEQLYLTDYEADGVRYGIELLLHTDGDWQALFRYQGAAYGIQATASANSALYNSELAGLDRPLYEVMCQQRGDGREILLEDAFYVQRTVKSTAADKGSSLDKSHAASGKGAAAEAPKVEKVSRKTLEQYLPKDRRNAFRAFCKDNDINWHKKADIIKAINFF